MSLNMKTGRSASILDSLTGPRHNAALRGVAIHAACGSTSAGFVAAAFGS
jgi:hypothetical protein